MTIEGTVTHVSCDVWVDIGRMSDAHPTSKVTITKMVPYDDGRARNKDHTVLDTQVKLEFQRGLPLQFSLNSNYRVTIEKIEDATE